MVRIALTGGIASGKSAVAALFEELGAVIIDADALAREVVVPGSPGLGEVVARFGPQVLGPDGAIDRARLGEIVFADDEARAALNAIVHPRVRDAAQRLEQGVAPGSVVLHVIPLLVEAGLADGFGHIVVVDVPEELQLSRLMARNGFTVEQAKARIDAQATRAKRLEVATWVIDNSGPMDATARQVDALWAGPIAEIRSAPGPSA